VAREIILIPEAVTDINHAYWWYEEQRRGLGEDFLICIETALDQVRNHPKNYPMRFDAFRRVLVRRFPYAIYFEHDESRVTVHYVFHCSQHPDKLARRLKKH
jgi:plasmid stabilization system protein ParE